MEFSTSRTEVPVTIDGKQYVMREATAGAAKKFRSASLTGAEMQFDGDDRRTVRRLQGITEVESLLVSMCLYDAEGKLVPQETVERWPAKVVKALFALAKEISDLGEDTEDAASLRKQREKIDRKLEGLEKN